MARIVIITVCTIFFASSSITKVTASFTVESTTIRSIAKTTETSTQTTLTTPAPLKCYDNEIVDECPVDCPSDYCPKSRYEDQSSCSMPEKCPAPACKCSFNYRRASNGTCIPTRSCPPFECNEENEVYDPCPPYCPGQSCSQATSDGNCHIFGFIGIVLPCEPACRCKMYYWRLNGTCVPYSQCPNQNYSIDTTTQSSATASTADREETIINKPESTTNKNYEEPEIPENINDCNSIKISPCDCGCDETDINVCECSQDPDCDSKNSKFIDSSSRDGNYTDNNNSEESDCGCAETDINVCECIRDPDYSCKNSKSIDLSNKDCNDKDNNNSVESDCGCDETDINVCECIRDPDCSCKNSKSIDSSNKDCNDKDNNNTEESDCGCAETDINVCECIRDPDCGCKDSKSTDASSRDCNDADHNNSEESDCGCDETDINVCECIQNPDCSCRNSKSIDSSNKDCNDKDNNNSEESDCGCAEKDINVCECIRDTDCGCNDSKSIASSCRDFNDKDNNSDKSNFKTDETVVVTDDCGYENSENCNSCDRNNDAADKGVPRLDCKETESDILIPEEMPVWKCYEDDNESEYNQGDCNSETTSQSPPTCVDHETLDDCPIDCPSDYCPKSRYDDQSPCPKPDNCPPPACKCRFNYRRNENGTCIPTESCPSFECNGLHEQYNACPAYCPGESCTNATHDGECHAIGNIDVVVTCKPACTCEKTYWRLKGNCVPYAECRECLDDNSTKALLQSPIVNN